MRGAGLDLRAERGGAGGCSPSGGQGAGMRVRVVTRLRPPTPGWGARTRSHATPLLRQLPRLRHRAARQGEPGPRVGRGLDSES